LLTPPLDREQSGLEGDDASAGWNILIENAELEPNRLELIG
jgi:hypothetical protein